MINPTLYALKTEIEQIKLNGLCKPRMAILYPTYKCNQSCSYCFFKSNESGHAMDYDGIKNIIDQLADYGVQSIEYCGGGEPLMFPGIEEIFEYAASKGLRQGLLTNGVLFSDGIAHAFLKHGTYVRFSLDSVNDEMYKKLRGVDDCAIVKMNIENAVMHKQKYDYLCQISIKVGMHKDATLEEIQAIFDFAYGKRIYSIQLKNLWDKNGNYYNVTHSRADIFRLINSWGIRFVKKIGTKKKMRERCWINPVQLTIDAYGDVFLCCYYQGREDSHKIGNMFKEKLSDIWGGEKHKSQINKTKIYECMKHDCRFMRYMDQARHQIKTGEWAFV